MADGKDGECSKSAKNMSTTYRLYDELPVWICEDHQEVLRHIYRAIGSRYLPFKGLTMVHFDSHPDMTFPPKLRAEEVFDKIKLMDAVGIADWILPAMYAGHISRLVWIKPPWADQIDEKRIKFKIGKQKSTGDVKVTCTECYFLHDLLYAPEEELTNCRDVDFIIVTLSCPELGTHSPVGVADKMEICPQEKHINSCNNQTHSNSRDIENCGNRLQNNEHQGETKSSDTMSCKVHVSKGETATETSGSMNCEKDLTLTDNMVDLQCENSEKITNLHKIGAHMAETDHENICSSSVVDATNNLALGSVKTEQEYVLESTSNDLSLPLDSVKESCEDNNNEGSRKRRKISHPDETSTCTPDTVENLIQLLNKILEPGEKYILDIDMDFFSVLNPFKQDYTKEEFDILTSLYTFSPPQSSSREDIDKCVEECRQKVEEFESTLNHLENIEKEKSGTLIQDIDHNNFIQDSNSIALNPALASVVKGLWNRKLEIPLDYELLHHAGLTCELPIHVSSDQEIDGLMRSVQEVLSKILSPTIVTMARSTEDEYTPPSQVENIQGSLLKVLDFVYLESEGINIYFDYKRNTEGSE